MSNVEVLDNKINFLMSITEEIHREMNLNFDFNMFVIKNNLTSTEVVLIIKALTIMGYRKFGLINEYINDFGDDKRFSSILSDAPPKFSEFQDFVKKININLDGRIILENLKKQKIGENICKFLLEDEGNN